jgi:hypothetical protein
MGDLSMMCQFILRSPVGLSVKKLPMRAGQFILRSPFISRRMTRQLKKLADRVSASCVKPNVGFSFAHENADKRKPARG